MIPIIRKAYVEEWTDHSVSFDIVGERGRGYGFDLNADGTLKFDDSHDAAWRAQKQGYLDACLAGLHNGEQIGPPHYYSNDRHYRHCAVGRCDCGAEVFLDGFTNTCDQCEADYNQSGQRLAPREQWGEETGESLSDILSVDHDRHEGNFG